MSPLCPEHPRRRPRSQPSLLAQDHDLDRPQRSSETFQEQDEQGNGQEILKLGDRPRRQKLIEQDKASRDDGDWWTTSWMRLDGLQPYQNLRQDGIVSVNAGNMGDGAIYTKARARSLMVAGFWVMTEVGS